MKYGMSSWILKCFQTQFEYFLMSSEWKYVFYNVLFLLAYQYMWQSYSSVARLEAFRALKLSNLATGATLWQFTYWCWSFISDEERYQFTSWIFFYFIFEGKCLWRKEDQDAASADMHAGIWTVLAWKYSKVNNTSFLSSEYNVLHILIMHKVSF